MFTITMFALVVYSWLKMMITWFLPYISVSKLQRESEKLIRD